MLYFLTPLIFTTYSILTFAIFFFKKWCQTKNYSVQVTEQKLYLYLEDLIDKGSAKRGRKKRKTLADGTVGLEEQVYISKPIGLNSIKAEISAMVSLYHEQHAVCHLL
jgi:hypothetical protein